MKNPQQAHTKKKSSKEKKKKIRESKKIKWPEPGPAKFFAIWEWARNCRGGERTSKGHGLQVITLKKKIHEALVNFVLIGKKKKKRIFLFL